MRAIRASCKTWKAWNREIRQGPNGEYVDHTTVFRSNIGTLRRKILRKYKDGTFTVRVV